MMDSSKQIPMISPLPWESGTGHITDATGEAIAQCFRSLSGDKQANSDLIVRAVNSHDQLVAALKHCAAVCSGETMSKQGLVNALEAARAALAAAGA